MNLRKTVFSYIILGLFIFFSGFCIFCTLEAAGFIGMFGWPLPVLIGAICLYLLLTAAVFMAFRTLFRELGKHIANKKRAETVFGIVLPVLTILGIAVYLALYLMYHIPIAFGDDTFYKMALVREGGDVIGSVHGASGLYVLLLHGMLLIFGNTPFAGGVLQIVLFFICLVLLYAGMRIYAGVFSAAVSTALFGFFPLSLEYVFSLTPELLYLVLYLFVFYLTGVLHHKFCERSTVFSGLYVLIFLTGAYGAFLYASEAFSAETGLTGAWSLAFNRENIVQVFGIPDYACIVFLSIISMAFFIVPAFFMRNKGQNSAFILNLFILYAFGILGIEGMRWNPAMILGWCMLAGVGICGTLRISEKAEEKECVKPEKEEKLSVAEEEKDVVEKEKKEIREQKEPAPGEPLHNPLPVPKRKSRPQADFGFEVKEEDMKFDITIAENDDFDV